jgi:hypothetical protein
MEAALEKLRVPTALPFSGKMTDFSINAICTLRVPFDYPRTTLQLPFGYPRNREVVTSNLLETGWIANGAGCFWL